MAHLLSKILSFLYDFIIVFFMSFELVIIGPITTRRIALIVVISYLLKNRKRARVELSFLNKKAIQTSLICFGICLVIALINNAFINGENENYMYFEPWFIIYEILYVFIMALYVLTRFRNVKYFGIICSIVMLFQAIVIFSSIYNDDLRFYVFEHFAPGGSERSEKAVEYGTRVFGIGLGYSAGSVLIAATYALLVYMLLKRLLNSLSFVIITIILILMTAFVGRTGLGLELLFISFYFICEKDYKRKFFNFVVPLLALIIGSLFILTLLDPVVAEYLEEWVGELFDPEKRENVANTIAEMETPDFTNEMIFGSGVIFGKTDGGQLVYSDSGYIRIWSGIGIVGAFFYYLAFLLIFASTKFYKNKTSVKWLLITIVVMAYVIEYKEPYFLKYDYARIALIILWFEIKMNKLNTIQYDNKQLRNFNC